MGKKHLTLKGGNTLCTLFWCESLHSDIGNIYFGILGRLPLAYLWDGIISSIHLTLQMDIVDFRFTEFTYFSGLACGDRMQSNDSLNACNSHCIYDWVYHLLENLGYQQGSIEMHSSPLVIHESMIVSKENRSSVDRILTLTCRLLVWKIKE